MTCDWVDAENDTVCGGPIAAMRGSRGLCEAHAMPGDVRVASAPKPCMGCSQPREHHSQGLCLRCTQLCRRAYEDDRRRDAEAVAKALAMARAACPTCGK